MRGRQSGSGSALGDFSEERPKPLPRQKRLQDDDDDVKPTSRTSPNVLDRKTPPTRRTPTTPVDRRKSPADDRDPFVSRHRLDDNDQLYRHGESRRSPLDRNSSMDRKSPHSDVFQTLRKDKYKKFDEGGESYDRYGASRKSPSDTLHSPVSRTLLSDRQQPSPLARKSSVEHDKFNRLHDRQKSPVDDRKTPTSDCRKTPVDFQQRKDSSSPSTWRKSSQLDLLMESTGGKESENSDEEKQCRERRHSGSPQSRGRKSISPSLRRSESTEKNPFESIHKLPATVSKVSRHSRSSDSLDAQPARPHSQVFAF